MRRHSALAIAVVLIALGAAPGASAHVTALSAASVGGTAIEITLTSPAESAFLSASGGRVERRSDDHFRLAVRPERSTVDIHVLSRDGHVTQIHLDRAETANPVVSTRSQRDPVLLILGRLLTLGALAVVAGALAVSRWVVLPGIRRPLHPLGVAVGPQHGAVESHLLRLVTRVSAIAIGVGAVGAVMSVAAILHRIASWDVLTLLRDTRVGHATLAIVVALVIGALCMRPSIFRLENATALIAGFGCAVALVAVSASGHATAGRDALLGAVFDAAHILGTAIWVGGLVVVLAAWRLIRKEAGDAAAGRIGAVVVRFSGVAIVCVATLAVTGVYRALAELSSVGDLVHTPYGRVLTVKLVLFTILLGIGAFNRFVIHPRLERVGIGLADSDRNAVRMLGPSVRAEIALATAVLVAVAVMIGFPPPG